MSDKENRANMPDGIDLIEMLLAKCYAFSRRKDISETYTAQNALEDLQAISVHIMNAQSVFKRIGKSAAPQPDQTGVE